MKGCMATFCWVRFMRANENGWATEDGWGTTFLSTVLHGGVHCTARGQVMVPFKKNKSRLLLIDMQGGMKYPVANAIDGSP
eukprot:1143174-Pelagomonas_calceolata.AAC.2